MSRFPGCSAAEVARRAATPPAHATVPQTFWIAGALPGFNQLTAGHWTAQRKLKQAAIRQVGRNLGPLHPVTRCEVLIACVEPTRRRDVDNVTGGAAKVIMDALVAHGLIPDDSPRYVRAVSFEEVEYCSEAPGVRVTVIPIGAA